MESKAEGDGGATILPYLVKKQKGSLVNLTALNAQITRFFLKNFGEV